MNTDNSLDAYITLLAVTVGGENQMQNKKNSGRRQGAFYLGVFRERTPHRAAPRHRGNGGALDGRIPVLFGTPCAVSTMTTQNRVCPRCGSGRRR